MCTCAQSCLTFCNPTDCSPPGSSANGILQARILEWVAISSSMGSSRPRDRTHASCINRQADGLPLSHQRSTGERLALGWCGQLLPPPHVLHSAQTPSQVTPTPPLYVPERPRMTWHTAPRSLTGGESVPHFLSFLLLLRGRLTAPPPFYES